MLADCHTMAAESSGRTTTPSTGAAASALALMNAGEDPDAIIKTRILSSRQNFLDLCTSNHYQFDELRRAKFSTAMIVWHLRFPSAPSIAPYCDHCGTYITEGFRYACTPCEYDLCPACHKSKKVHPPHKHRLRPESVTGYNCSPSIEVADASVVQDGTPNGPVVVNPHRRVEVVKNWLKLLDHVARCKPTPPTTCPHTQCQGLKDLLVHTRVCSGGSECYTCRPVINLLRAHGRKCQRPRGACAVPGCARFKELYEERRRRAALGLTDVPPSTAPKPPGTLPPPPAPGTLTRSVSAVVRSSATRRTPSRAKASPAKAKPSPAKTKASKAGKAKKTHASPAARRTPEKRRRAGSKTKRGSRPSPAVLKRSRSTPALHDV